MSHASVLVVLDGKSRETIEKQVEFQMAPFDENGACFKNGSRWDWWGIGGRFSGQLDSYDPSKDPKNWERCEICHGTGMRTDDLGTSARMKDPSYTCNGCGGDRETTGQPGVCVKFPTKWKAHSGDVATKGSLNLVALAAKRRAASVACWHKAQLEKGDIREWVYGVKGDESLEAYLERNAQYFAPVIPPHYALLRDRHWNEPKRMGWFGASAATECERAEGEPAQKCLYKDKATGARIVSWNCDRAIWQSEVWPKLCASIPDDAILVTVDYHV